MLKKIKNNINNLLYKIITRNVIKKPFSGKDKEGLLKEGFFSQCGQDKFIVNILNGKRGGIFIEIGACDGIKYSNTYYLEKNLDWTGVLVEPMKRSFEKLKTNRKCQVLNACAGDKDDNVEFLEVEGVGSMLSGIIDRFEKGHMEKIGQAVKEYGLTVNNVVIPCYTFETICRKFGITKVDYLSIDTEGGEIDILKSINFKSVDIGLISLENLSKQTHFYRLLKRQGYRLIAIIGWDEIYQKNYN